MLRGHNDGRQRTVLIGYLGESRPTEKKHGRGASRCAAKIDF
jgi:hypothetical protein